MTDETLSFLSPFAGGTSVGVAIEVPAPWSTALRGLRERVEGHAGQEIIPPHITLVPPTTLPTYDLTDVERHLERAARTVAPFRVELAGPGTFRPTTQVVYAALAQGAQECDALQRAARRGPLAQDLRFDYHPHVTVAQDAAPDLLDSAEAALEAFHAVFAVTGFQLYELGPDDVWHTMRTFPLTGRA
ncbi:MAG TPA: hypothetical protein DHV14_12085 [Micrococcales bacterium]|uniref:2'-5' RNA ligase family protein n=1 Tax=Miniimonas arenae TaxID=676201 RepID=A0A5C5B8T0_9MICO|nr:2'-5' RNA ligase family protein [Miniimonas arenae]TNU73260.1 2'-5' RNA ligase family protein [Miniimonas arenae]HCX85848.1 hypothetical protein [Micrococcales bacterium]